MKIKNLLLIPFLLPCSGLVCGQTKTKPKRPVSRSAAAPPLQPRFSDEWSRIPRGFKGHDMEPIFRNLLFSADKFSAKDEFETSDRYYDRTAHPTGLKLGGGLTANDDLLFVYRPGWSPSSEGLSGKYDADRGIFDVEIPARSFSVFKDGGRMGLSYRGTQIRPKTGGKVNSYLGENGFGVKRKIDEYVFETYYLAISNFDEFSKYPGTRVDKISIEIKCLPEAARRLKENLTALFIVKLSRPYFLVESMNIKPTISDPNEIRSYDEAAVGDVKAIWIYDSLTGEIFKKLRPLGNRVIPEPASTNN